MVATLEKLVLLGEPAVGKTSIARRMCDQNYFSEVYVPTNGLEFFTKKLENQPNIAGTSSVILQVWEAGAHELMHSQCVSTAMLRNVTCAMLVYDTTNKTTLANCWRWFELISKNVGITIMLVGTKADLIGKREVHQNEGMEKARQFGAVFGECSTKLSNETVTTLLNSLLIESQERRVRPAPPISPPQPPRMETVYPAPKMRPPEPPKREAPDASEDSNPEGGTPSRISFRRYQPPNYTIQNSAPGPALVPSMPHGTPLMDSPTSGAKSGKFEPTERPALVRETYQQLSVAQQTPQPPPQKIPPQQFQYSQYPQFSQHSAMSQQNPMDNLSVSVEGFRNQSVNARNPATDLELKYFPRQNSRPKIGVEQLRAPQTMQELQQLRQAQPYSTQPYSAPRIGLPVSGQPFFRANALSPLPTRVMPQIIYPAPSTAPPSFTFGWRK